MTLAIGSYLSPKVRLIACSLVRGLIKGQPEETLAYFMSKTCESIEKSIEVSIGHEEDIELNWYLNLFVELVRARGDTLLLYQSTIMSIFRQCISISTKKSYEFVADVARYLLESLTQIYPIDSRVTTENTDELPIRVSLCSL